MEKTPGFSGLSGNHSEELLQSPLTGTSPYSARGHLSSPQNQTQALLSSTLRPLSPLGFTTTVPSTSRRSSPAPQYLSPPLIGSDNEGPPYLPGPDDLVSLDLHIPRKCRRSRRVDSELNQTLPLRQDRAIKKSIKMTSAFTWGREEGMASANTEDTTALGSSASCSIPTNGNLFTLCKSSKPKGLPYSRVPDVSATRNHEIPESRNPRLSSSSYSITAVPEGLVVKRSAPIQSRAHICARGYPGDFKPGNNIHDLPVAPWIEDSEGQTSVSSTDYQCQHSTRDRHHETPASITLRKASKQYARDLGNRRSLQLSAYSEGRVACPILPQRLDGDMGSCDNTSSPSFSSFCHFAMPLNTVLGRDPGVSDHASFPPTELADKANIQGQRSGTGVALTAAEVHNSPRAFSFPRTSRTSSSLAIDTMQSCLVQIHSAGSVHRVIWAPDDTPSSSTSQDTSGLNEQPSRSRSSTEVKSCGLIQPELSQSGQEIIRPQYSHPTLAPSNHTTKLPSPQVPAGILDWDWQAWGHRKEKAIASRAWAGDRISPAGKKPSRITQPGRWSKKWKAHLDNETGVIESFPPLLARLSSEHWQTKQPVDLNDLTHIDSGLTQGKNEELSPVESGGITEVDEEMCLVKLDTSERLRHSKVGTAIGSSSHTRRPSVQQQPQITYQSVMELTNALSRNASSIRQSLSGQPSFAGRDSGENKSAP